MALAGFKLEITGGSLFASIVDVGMIDNHTFTGLDPDTEYSVRIARYDDSIPPVQSAWSLAVRATTDPVPPPFGLRINAGHSVTQGRWVDETPYVSGGTAFTNGLTGYYEEYSKPLPGHPETDGVYASGRRGSLPVYTITGLTPSENVTVRVHAHGYDAGSGVYVQTIKANGSTVVAEYDVSDFAGGGHKTGIQEFTAAADGSGVLAISFHEASGKDCNVNAIEFYQPVLDPRYRIMRIFGDSITSGTGGGGGDPAQWSSLIAAGLGSIDYGINFTVRGGSPVYDETKPYIFHNLAQPGTLIEVQMGHIADFVTPTDYSCWQIQPAYFMCGINNIVAAGESAATVIGRIEDFFAALPASISHKIIAKILPTQYTLPGSGFDLVVNDVNDWIEANSLGCDFVMDFVALDSRFADPLNTAYYYDGLHPTAALYTVQAAIMEPILLGLTP